MNEIQKEKIAEELLQIKAVQLRPDKPFVWASGLLSPVYCDNRKTLSYPRLRTYIRNCFVDLIELEFGKPDAIVGVATGGIAQGVLVAQQMDLPFAYVRPEPKKHGMENQLEGDIRPGQSVVVLEDLISTGSSSLKAVESLKKNEIQVKGLVAIFTYNLKKSYEAFKKARVPYYALTDFHTLTKVAVNKQYIKEKDLEILEEWAVDPEEWIKGNTNKKKK